jgi:hypothetical protein
MHDRQEFSAGKEEVIAINKGGICCQLAAALGAATQQSDGGRGQFWTSSTVGKRGFLRQEPAAPWSRGFGSV